MIVEFHCIFTVVCKTEETDPLRRSVENIKVYTIISQAKSSNIVHPHFYLFHRVRIKCTEWTLISCTLKMHLFLNGHQHRVIAAARHIPDNLDPDSCEFNFETNGRMMPLSADGQSDPPSADGWLTAFSLILFTSI